jgi:hypothetical protein
MPALDRFAERSQHRMTVCSGCKRVRAPAGGWLELEHASVRLSLLAQRCPPALQHDLCETCRSQLLAAARGTAPASH